MFADADALKLDNSRRASLAVWERLPVLLVNGEPSALPLKGETDYLQLALQPFANPAGGIANLISAQVDETLASYSVLSAMGLLTAQHLGLNVQIYDPAAYYNLVDDAPTAMSQQGEALDRVLRAIGN